MKKAIFSMFAALMMLVSFGASAQTVGDLYTSSNGKTFNIAYDRAFECVTGAVLRTKQGGGVTIQSDFTDTSGSVCSKMEIDHSSTWVKVGASRRYMNPAAISYTFCHSGGYTVAVYESGSNIDFNTPSDGCAVDNAFKAKRRNP